MRGKRREEQERQRLQRIIPARAGQTPPIIAYGFFVADHPRACGANVPHGYHTSSAIGSSPRVRGKHAYTHTKQAGGRIIPARAGQTCRSPCTGPSRTDHPRACGANVHVAPKWGGRRRIIPARAGQTGPVPSVICLGTDHPRACGANLVGVVFAVIFPGSSPRVRGKRRARAVETCEPRIIPARAGQTRSRSPHSSPYPDHPRACGANPDSSWTRRSPSGSSPRVRGKLVDGFAGIVRDRIIPARAGQTIW